MRKRHFSCELEIAKLLMVLALCVSFLKPYSLTIRDGKSLRHLASKRIWHLLRALKMGLVLISISAHGNLHLA